MIKSMTGFGRCEVAEGDRKFTVEMKGVNHRYLDANIRMPKKLNFFDSAIRSLLKQYVQRGKVDIFITYEDMSENQVSLKYNEKRAYCILNIVSIIFLFPIAVISFLVLIKSRYNFSLLWIVIYIITLLIAKKTEYI